MKKLFYLLYLVAAPFFSFSQSAELSEAECKSKIDSIYNSLSYQKALKEVAHLCLSNPNNPTTLINLFLQRQHNDKKELEEALDRVRPENKSNVSNDQIQKGNNYYDFVAKTSKGEEFRLSEVVKSKDVFLIFGGLDCMGKDSRNALIDIYRKLNRSKVEIVSFMYVGNEKELNEVVEKYQIPWVVVSDFQGDHSRTKIIYDAQVRPTSVYINSSGKVIVSATNGLSQKAIKLTNKHIIK